MPRFQYSTYPKSFFPQINLNCLVNDALKDFILLSFNFIKGAENRCLHVLNCQCRCLNKPTALNELYLDFLNI